VTDWFASTRTIDTIEPEICFLLQSRLYDWMRVEEPLSFSVTHIGRGGYVRIRSSAGEILLAIEMLAGGSFAVFLRGARVAAGHVDADGRRLRTYERQLVLERLRGWLDSTGRECWAIEG